jgi:hypothetical protein
VGGPEQVGIHKNPLVADTPKEEPEPTTTFPVFGCNVRLV